VLSIQGVLPSWWYKFEYILDLTRFSTNRSIAFFRPLERHKIGRRYPQLGRLLGFIRFEKQGFEIPFTYDADVDVDVDIDEETVEIGIDWCLLFVVVCRSSNVRGFALDGEIRLDGVCGRRGNNT